MTSDTDTLSGIHLESTSTAVFKHPVQNLHTQRNTANSWSADHAQRTNSIIAAMLRNREYASTKRDILQPAAKRMSSRSRWGHHHMTYFSGRNITTEDCCGREVPAGVRQVADGYEGFEIR